jgi:hypothetical protein
MLSKRFDVYYTGEAADFFCLLTHPIMSNTMMLTITIMNTRPAIEPNTEPNITSKVEAGANGIVSVTDSSLLSANVPTLPIFWNPKYGTVILVSAWIALADVEIAKQR